MADLAQVDKVRKLIALATNPAASLEESRTAAVSAVRLMREHSILEDRTTIHVQHCDGCSCYERPAPSAHRTPEGDQAVRPPPAWWRPDFDETQKSEEDRKYAEGWDRVWGTTIPRGARR